MNDDHIKKYSKNLKHGLVFFKAKNRLFVSIIFFRSSHISTNEKKID